MPIRLREAAETDLPAIQLIYAHHVRHGLGSFEEIPPSVDEFVARWRAVMSLDLPYLVAERNGVIVGYSYAAAYHPRSAYRYVVEDSVYVAEDISGQGVGSALLQTLIARCETGAWRQMIAVIGNSSNISSIALHRRMGFRPVGTLRSVGFKFGRWVDVVLMQRALSAGDKNLPTETLEHPREGTLTSRSTHLDVQTDAEYSY
ncbi:MAG: N-acetyltransferase family protein [Steroidobacteraceae bacterium]